MANQNQTRNNRETVFPNQITTIADLMKFKKDIVEKLKSLITAIQPKPFKRWLKSFEIKELLHISTGTLHNLRTNGTLPFTKIGGVVFYDMVAVEQILEKHTTFKKVSK
jgi:hypothetical protein